MAQSDKRECGARQCRNAKRMKQRKALRGTGRRRSKGDVFYFLGIEIERGLWRRSVPAPRDNGIGIQSFGSSNRPWLSPIQHFMTTAGKLKRCAIYTARHCKEVYVMETILWDHNGTLGFFAMLAMPRRFFLPRPWVKEEMLKGSCPLNEDLRVASSTFPLFPRPFRRTAARPARGFQSLFCAPE